MPFSWKKKTRRNRFSQLVADHIQSPKRGGSLVVETGFPTSLIDLYVRNRGRFRKSSGNKQRDSDGDSPTRLSSPSLSQSGLAVDSNNLSSVSSSSSLYPSVDSNKFSGDGLDHRGSDEIIEEDMVVVSENEIKNCAQNEVERSVEMAKLNPVLVVVMKVLFVVMVVLGTKRFTVGITMSAFVLLLLELVGKVLVRRSKTASGSSVYETDKIGIIEENAVRGVCSEVLEIEEEVELKQEVGLDKELDEVRSEVSMEIKRKSSRRAVMKLKMKKLVPKKLRKSSTGSKEEISYHVIEEESVKSAQDSKTVVISSECSDSSKGETLRILKRNQDRIVEVEGRSLSSALSSEIDCDGKELGQGLHQDYGCLVLCLVVLVGLIGGRVLALVLALSWCLMQKKLQWRNVKFPIS